MTTASSAPNRRELLGGGLAALPFGALAAPARPVSDPLLALGARDAVGHIRDGALSAETYVERLIAQGRRHAALNGVVALDPERMREAARAVDLARRRGDRLGPAAGLPVAVKDQIAVAGYPAASGNPALAAYRPERDAAVVEVLVRAGAIAFAKTACPNMTGTTSATAQEESYSPAYGLVRNPYDPTRSAGGSSGGSGVVLAARITPAALGEDSNGSVRVPASFCGVAGLRPSTHTIDAALHGGRRKRYPDDGLIIAAGRIDTIGPMARSVADLAFLDHVITGGQTPAIRLAGSRIAVPRGDYWEQPWLDPRVARTVRAALERLRDAGARLVEIDYLALRATVGDLGSFTTMALAAERLGAREDPAADPSNWLRGHMPGVSLDAFVGKPLPNKERAFGTAPRLARSAERALLADRARQYRAIFAEHGVLAIAAPTVPILPQPLTPGGPTDAETINLDGRTFDRASLVIAQTVIAPRYGAPALSLPAGIADNLPVGLALDGLPGHDTDLLGLGVAIESVLDPTPPPFL